jgi:hypothetical protein
MPSVQTPFSFGPTGPAAKAALTPPPLFFFIFFFSTAASQNQYQANYGQQCQSYAFFH